MTDAIAEQQKRVLAAECVVHATKLTHQMLSAMLDRTTATVAEANRNLIAEQQKLLMMRTSRTN